CPRWSSAYALSGWARSIGSSAIVEIVARTGHVGPASPTPARSARPPLLELDSLEARRVGTARNATALRDRPAVDLLDVAGEVDRRGAADVRAHGVRVDRRAGLLEHP